MAEYIQLLRFRGHLLTSALFSLYILVDSFIAVTLHISKIYLCMLYKYTLTEDYNDNGELFGGGK